MKVAILVSVLLVAFLLGIVALRLPQADLTPKDLPWGTRLQGNINGMDYYRVPLWASQRR